MDISGFLIYLFELFAENVGTKIIGAIAIIILVCLVMFMVKKIIKMYKPDVKTSNFILATVVILFLLFFAMYINDKNETREVEVESTIENESIVNVPDRIDEEDDNNIEDVSNSNNQTIDFEITYDYKIRVFTYQSRSEESYEGKLADVEVFVKDLNAALESKEYDKFLEGEMKIEEFAYFEEHVVENEGKEKVINFPIYIYNSKGTIVDIIEVLKSISKKYEEIAFAHKWSGSEEIKYPGIGVDLIEPNEGYFDEKSLLQLAQLIDQSKMEQ